MERFQKAKEVQEQLKNKVALDVQCIREVLQLPYSDDPQSRTLCQTMYQFIYEFCPFDPVFAMLEDSLNFQDKFVLSYVLVTAQDNDSKVNK